MKQGRQITIEADSEGVLKIRVLSRRELDPPAFRPYGPSWQRRR